MKRTNLVVNKVVLNPRLPRRSKKLVEVVAGIWQLGEDVHDVLVQVLAGVALHRRVEHRSVPFVQNLEHFSYMLGCGGCLVVSALAYCSEDPSLYPTGY